MPSRFPVLRLRLTRGALVCLLRPHARATNQDCAAALAVIASPHAPFLRRLRLYRRPDVPPPGGAPRAA
jgi:hypothetical protein